jgi:hypothetical protein
MTTDAELPQPAQPLLTSAPGRSGGGPYHGALYLSCTQLKIGRYVRLDASVTYGSMSLKPLALKYSGVSNAEAPARS